VSELSGPKVILMGPSGTGKTYALGTAVDWAAANDMEVFVPFIENGRETLMGYWLDRGMEVPACLHWHDQFTTTLSFDQLVSMADNVGKLSYEAVTKSTDPNRSKNNALLEIFRSCADFPDDRTGKKFGPIDSWSEKRIFIIDSLSELSNAALKTQIGAKPTAAPPDYGVAQNMLMNFLRKCTQACRCTFILTAHVDREVDVVSGSTKIMVKAVGKALAGEIPQLFSDVIYTVREGDKFYWDTAAYGVDTKTRSLGYRSKIDPTFAALFDIWRKRGGR
jgi:hypothetical protein